MIVLVLLLLTIGPLAVDMYYRKPGPESLARAVVWSTVYVASAAAFATYLSIARGAAYSALFISGYAIEKSMSMDNLVVFGSVFAYFGVRAEYQYRVLHYGIVAAAALRLLFIAAGLGAFFLFGRVLDVVFGVVVIATAWKMIGGEAAGDIDHGKRWYIRWSMRFFPVSPDMSEGRFFVRMPHWPFSRGIAATPLLFCLIAMEITDIAFAFDSVPAVLGITRDTMIAYSSVMFAVIGLRSMYFVLEALKRYTTALGSAVMAILWFVGGKMVIHGLLNIDVSTRDTVLYIVGCLAFGVSLSIYRAVRPRVTA